MITLIYATVESPTEREFMLRVYDTYERLMFATARKYCSDEYSVEDIVQEGLLKLIQKVNLLQTLEEKALVSYIIATMRNTAYSYLRKQVREKKNVAFSEDVVEGMPDDLTMEEKMIVMERQERVTMIWPHVSEEDRFLLDGKYRLNCSDEELAGQLQCKPSSIRMKLTRARRRVLHLLVELEEGVSVP